jgi:hypothetical protein
MVEGAASFLALSEMKLDYEVLMSVNAEAMFTLTSASAVLSPPRQDVSPGNVDRFSTPPHDLLRVDGDRPAV